jgi:hypothetical protein
MGKAQENLDQPHYFREDMPGSFPSGPSGSPSESASELEINATRAKRENQSLPAELSNTTRSSVGNQQEGFQNESSKQSHLSNSPRA